MFLCIFFLLKFMIRCTIKSMSAGTWANTRRGYCNTGGNGNKTAQSYKTQENFHPYNKTVLEKYLSYSSKHSSYL